VFIWTAPPPPPPPPPPSKTTIHGTCCARMPLVTTDLTTLCICVSQRLFAKMKEDSQVERWLSLGLGLPLFCGLISSRGFVALLVLVSVLILVLLCSCCSLILVWLLGSFPTSTEMWSVSSSPPDGLFSFRISFVYAWFRYWCQHSRTLLQAQKVQTNVAGWRPGQHYTGKYFVEDRAGVGIYPQH
jgi:hypothetical protein